MGVDFEILKILYRLNYSDFYFVWYCYNVIIVLSMHFNWFFSAKANFRVCIEAQKISVAIFFPCQSLLLSTSVLNESTSVLNDRQQSVIQLQCFAYFNSLGFVMG